MTPEQYAEIKGLTVEDVDRIRQWFLAIDGYDNTKDRIVEWVAKFTKEKVTAERLSWEKRMAEIKKRLEWMQFAAGSTPTCPLCGRQEPDGIGHTDDCPFSSKKEIEYCPGGEGHTRLPYFRGGEWCDKCRRLHDSSKGGKQ